MLQKIVHIGTAYENCQLSASKKYMSYGSENKSHDTLYIYKASCKILVACNTLLLRIMLQKILFNMTTLYEKFLVEGKRKQTSDGFENTSHNLLYINKASGKMLVACGIYNVVAENFVPKILYMTV